MPDAELSPQEIEEAMASAEMEQYRLTTPKTGTYAARIVSARCRRTDAQAKYSPNRLYMMLVLTLHELDTFGRLVQTPTGKVFCRVSWQMKLHDQTNEPDNMSRLWLELADALRMDHKYVNPIYQRILQGGAVLRVFGKDCWRDPGKLNAERMYLETEEDDKREEFYWNGFRGEFVVFNIRPHHDRGMVGAGVENGDADESMFGVPMGEDNMFESSDLGRESMEDDIPF